MSPFIETIRIQGGKLQNLSCHQARFNRAREEILGLKEHPLLQKVIPVPGGLEEGIFKCRVLYGKDIDRIEYEPHLPLQVRSLQVVTSDTISYSHKFSNRSALTDLYEKRGECDDILIVRNGCITDSYYANVVLWNGNSWVTPDTPLLPGTMCAGLLDSGKIKESRITLYDLGNYFKIRLINALNSLDESPDISMRSVFL